MAPLFSSIKQKLGVRRC